MPGSENSAGCRRQPKQKRAKFLLPGKFDSSRSEQNIITFLLQGIKNIKGLRYR